MREFELLIDEALKKGLSPEPIMSYNSQFLSNCLGFRCGRAGLEVNKLLTNPLPSTIDMYYSWPFPQFIIGEGYGILVIRDDTVDLEDKIYAVSEDHLTLTHIFDIDQLTFGKGTLMEVADFGEYLFMTNGVCMIYWDPALLTWQPITVSATIPMMRTVCNFKGQVVGGNVVSSWYDCDETFYIWSRIGSIDFTIDQDNEAGYKRCPYGGEVYHTRQIGNFVVGYSSKGVTLMMTVSEPVTSFGFQGLSGIGLINQGAMNGDKDRQVYVGEDYILREVALHGDLTKHYTVTELGYQQYMEQLTGEDIIVSYNPQTKDFYIGNSTKTFLLSPYGMTEIKQHPSTVWRRNKTSYMIPSYVDDDLSYIGTEPFDMGYKGYKTIFSIESDVSLATGPEAGFDYTNNMSTWNLDHYKPMNNQGIAAIIGSGETFRIKLRFASLNEQSRIGYIKVRYKMTDLRGIRGVYAPGLRGNQKG